MCKSCIPRTECGKVATMTPLHCHTDYSNIRLLDSVNRVEDLINAAVKMGNKGVAITDHEVLSAHMKAIEYVEKGKEKGTIPSDFKLILGNEIYLIEDREKAKELYGNPEHKVRFYHYLLLAKNAEGHKALRKLSSTAWENSFWTGTMERVPTEERYLEQIVKEHPNSLIASSACMGGRIPQEIMTAYHHMEIAEKLKSGEPLPTKSDTVLREEHNRARRNKNAVGRYEFKYSFEENRVIENGWNTTVEEQMVLASKALQTAKDYILWNVGLFGDDFYLELQPATYKDQIIVNKQLVEFSKELGVPLIITTDAHYVRPEDQTIHEAFLNAKDGEREVADFYAHTYLHFTEEIYEKMNYLDKEVISQALINTIEITNKVEEYTLAHETIIPRINVPEFELQHTFKKWYDKYEYINNMCNSEEEQDRYLMHMIEKGFIELLPYKEFSNEKFHEYLDRINSEVGELWRLSEAMNQNVSSYYVTTARLVEIIWADDECSGSFETGSLVGFGRGSAVAFLINYLMGITMVNPLEYGIEIPHWRLGK